MYIIIFLPDLIRKVLAFHREYDASCGLDIYGFYDVQICSLNACFLSKMDTESFEIGINEYWILSNAFCASILRWSYDFF